MAGLGLVRTVIVVGFALVRGFFSDELVFQLEDPRL